jgi:hypothetical protein
MYKTQYLNCCVILYLKLPQRLKVVKFRETGRINSERTEILFLMMPLVVLEDSVAFLLTN